MGEGRKAGNFMGGCSGENPGIFVIWRVNNIIN